MPILLGKNNGEIPVYSKGAINSNLDKTQYIKEQLGPKTTELIDVMDKEIEELETFLQEDTRIADDENEQPSVCERAREKLEKIPKEELSLNKRESSLWRSYPFGSG